MSSIDMFGWDMLYRIIENDIRREADVLIAITHWYLVKHSSMRCLGIGEDTTLAESEEGSELLPRYWNDNSGYSLRYVYNKQLFILLGTMTEDSILLNLLNVRTQDLSNLTLHLKNTVKALKGSTQTLLPDIQLLLHRIKNELVDPTFSGGKQDVTTQTTQDRPHNYIDPLSIPLNHNRFYDRPGRSVDPLRDIGRGDLDPLGRGGGGMLFNPNQNPNFHTPGLFQPRNPPGARFDPFNPPEENIPGFPNRHILGPNNDHFRPPRDDYDHMFQ